MAGKGTLTVKVLGDARSFEKTMGSLGKTAAVAFAAVGAAGVAGAVKALGAFTEFETQMNEVFTLLPGISGKAMDDMSGQVKNFSKEFGVLPDEVVPALYQALSAGVPKDNVFEFLETAQMAAKGGVTELTTAVDGISSVVNAYGSDVISATKASDLMFTAVRLGKTNFEQLSASLSNVTPIASGLGVSFEDVSAGLAALTAKGTPTAEATTQLRSLFVELSKAGGNTAKVFEDVAGKSFQEFIAKGGNTAEALKLMQKAADNSNVQLQDLFGSVEAGAAALSLASGDAFTDNIEEMGAAAGATEDAFDQMMTGLGPIFDKVKAHIAVFLIDVGKRLAPIVEEAMKQAGKAFRVLSAWWDEHGPAIISRVERLKDAIVQWISAARPRIEGFVKKVLGALSRWWEKNGPVIVGWVQNVAKAITNWIRDVTPPIREWVEGNLANMAKWWNDHGPTILAVVEALRDGLLKAIDVMVDAVQFVVDQWDKFKVALGVAVAIMIPHYVALAAAAVASSAKQVAAWVATQVAAIKAAAVHSAQVLIMIAKWALLAPTAIGYAAIVVSAWVMTQAAAIKAAIITTAQTAVMIGRWAAHAAAAMASALVVAAAWVIALGPVALLAAAAVAAVILIIIHWDTLKRKAIELKDGIVANFNALIDFIKGLPGRIRDAAKGLWDGIPKPPSFKIPGLSGIGGLRIPGLHTGVQNFGGGLAVVGERGPELVNLPRGSDVIPNHSLAQTMPGGRGGGSMQPQIIQVVLDGQVLAEVVNNHNLRQGRNRGDL